MPLPQIRIVSISPYPEMERIVQDVIAAHPQRGRIDNRIITATVDRLDLSELHDCDAIIARGYSARRLKAQGLGVPVIDIAISGYDVIRSIQECQRRFQTRSIGFVGFYNAFNGIEQFSGMFGCDIRVYIPECAAEIRHALELAKQDGCDVIVGGYSVQQDAGLLGLPAILLRTGRETYAQSLEEAIRTVTLVQQERIRTETYKIITESVKDGLLYVDASGIIRLDNPAACLMRDAPLKDVPLETAFPCMKDSFSRAMRDCAEIQGEVRKVRGVSITFDCTPVAVNGIAAGVVISFQNVDKVQQLEGHIRKKLSNKGLTAKHHLSDIVHCSRLIDETIEDACRYAAASSNILIVGETGTGKELFAQGIHNASQRRNGPFVAINCAALPENLLESELFGYVEGAFTGTTRGGKMGLFELAHNGTLFLDEISEIPLNMQSKLLRVLQEHEVRRIGDDRVTAVDVRIISATNVNLHKLVAAKRFRQDLLYRLDVLKITIPPLRRRGGGRHRAVPLFPQEILLEEPRGPAGGRPGLAPPAPGIPFRGQRAGTAQRRRAGGRPAPQPGRPDLRGSQQGPASRGHRGSAAPSCCNASALPSRGPASLRAGQRKGQAARGPARLRRQPDPCRPRTGHGPNHTMAQTPEIYTEITSTSNRLPFWAQGRRRNGLLHICCNDPLHPYSVATARRPPPRRFAGAPRSRPPRSV